MLRVLTAQGLWLLPGALGPHFTVVLEPWLCCQVALLPGLVTARVCAQRCWVCARSSAFLQPGDACLHPRQSLSGPVAASAPSHATGGHCCCGLSPLLRPGALSPPVPCTGQETPGTLISSQRPLARTACTSHHGSVSLFPYPRIFRFPHCCVTVPSDSKLS